MTKIGWTDHTFNPWWGCTKISPGCANCYADSDAKRYGFDIWGDDKPRRFFSDEHFRELLKWDAKHFRCRSCDKWTLTAHCKCGGIADERRPRVFMASFADFWEDRSDLLEHQVHALDFVALTDRLDYQILTKRPENVLPILRRVAKRGGHAGQLAKDWLDGSPPANVWMGVTTENQKCADERIPLLLETPAAVRFLSVEPMLGPVKLHPFLGAAYVDASGVIHRGVANAIDWVIVGGESGNKARPFDVRWAAHVLETCRKTGTPAFMKQYGQKPSADGVPLVTISRKGDDPDEWPPELRVREFPIPRSR